MFIGHYAPALVAAAHPRAPGLGTLFVAGQLIDFGFFAFTLAGIEHMRITPGITEMNAMDLYDMPYTHSLLGSAVWAAGFAALVYALTRNRMGALLAAAVVVSHWALDFLVHRPDLTLAGTPPKLGLGLWNYPFLEMPLEIGLVAGGMAYYLVRTRRKEGKGNATLWALVTLFAVLQGYNWFSPPPAQFGPDLPILGLVAYTLFALVAMWFGGTRRAKAAPAN